MFPTGFLYPRINEMSLRVFDELNGSVIVHGGIPWSTNPDRFSPLKRPINDLYRFDIDKTNGFIGKWSELNTVHDANIKFQFADDEYEPDRIQFPFEASDCQPLPCLAGHMGDIYSNPQSSSTYLIIFGGLRIIKLDSATSRSRIPFTELTLEGSVIYSGAGHIVPSNRMISMELTTNSWRNVLLSLERKVAKRIQGTTVVCGEKLFVFGGLVQESGNAQRMVYAETYAVSDLKEHRWVVPNGRHPLEIGVLGIHPAVATHLDSDGKERIVIIRGEQRHIETTFTNAFIFNPSTYTFEGFINIGGDIPPTLDYFVLQKVPTNSYYGVRHESSDPSQLKPDDGPILYGWTDYGRDWHLQEGDADSESVISAVGDDEHDDRALTTGKLCTWSLNIEDQEWKKVAMSIEQVWRVERKMSMELGCVALSRSPAIDNSGIASRMFLHLLGFSPDESRLPAGRLFNCHELVAIRASGVGHSNVDVEDDVAESLLDESSTTLVGSEIGEGYTLDLFM